MTKHCQFCGDVLSDIDTSHLCSKGPYAVDTSWFKFADDENERKDKMSEFSRFDMEQQIMQCWSICEALDDITEGVLEHGWTNDQVTNVSVGLKEQYQLRFNKLFDMFEQGIRQRKIL